MSLEQEIENSMAAVRRIVDQIKEKVRALPDNPRITRLGPNTFTVRKKDLIDPPREDKSGGAGISNWTPEHHDFIMQYDAILDAIDSGDPAHVFTRLRNILATEYVQVTSQYRIKLHPDVVHHLQVLVDKEAL